MKVLPHCIAFAMILSLWDSSADAADLAPLKASRAITKSH